jgi:cold shock CspA family protein
MRGTIDELVIDRGFGYIIGEDGLRYFFHRSALQGTDWEEIAPGQAVEFGIATEAPGDQPYENPRAINVRLAPEEIPAVDHEVLPPEKVR